MPRPQSRQAHGFTLIELLIVVGLVAILATVLAPQLGAGLGFALDGATRRVADQLQYASQRAVATGVVHRWTVDLDAQLFRLEERAFPDDDEYGDGAPTHAGLLDLAPPVADWQFVSVPNQTGEWGGVGSDTIAIEVVWIGDDAYEDGVVSIAFAPDGAADPAAVRVVDDYGYHIDVEVLAFSGEVRIRDDDS